MTNQEFSERFDTLLRAFKMQVGRYEQSILEFDEYEKSIFLTQAQDQIVTTLYRRFEADEEIRNYLRNLVTNYKTSAKISSVEAISDLSVFFQIPENTMFILNSSVNLNGKIVSTLPITHDEYYLQIDNPYRKPKVDYAWRIDYGSVQDVKVVEVVAEPTINSFAMRYLRRPLPIILVDLGDLTIDGRSQATESELVEDIHEEILNMAINMAIQSLGDTQDKKQSNK